MTASTRDRPPVVLYPIGALNAGGAQMRSLQLLREVKKLRPDVRIIVFLGYVSVAAALDVTLAFAAFLAGFGIVGGIKSGDRSRFQAPLDSIAHV